MADSFHVWWIEAQEKERAYFPQIEALGVHIHPSHVDDFPALCSHLETSPHSGALIVPPSLAGKLILHSTEADGLAKAVSAADIAVKVQAVPGLFAGMTSVEAKVSLIRQHENNLYFPRSCAVISCTEASAWAALAVCGQLKIPHIYCSNIPVHAYARIKAVAHRLGIEESIHFTADPSELPRDKHAIIFSEEERISLTDSLSSSYSVRELPHEDYIFTHVNALMRVACGKTLSEKLS